MNVLALDLGNSALKGALVGPADRVSHAFRIAHKPPEAIEVLHHRLAALPRPDAVAFASVVPARTAGIVAALTSVLGLVPLVVHAGSRWPFTIAYATPDTVGADRLAAVCGALDLDAPEPRSAARPLVVVDAGTATTIEAVTAERVYLGGAIAPGPVLMAAALASGTAQLQALDLPARLPPAIGQSTGEAITSGVLHGFAHGIAGLVAAARHALSPDMPDAVRVVATGGWAELLAPLLPPQTVTRPHLVLVGLARLARREADSTTTR